MEFFRSGKFSLYHSEGYIFFVVVSDISPTNFLIFLFFLLYFLGVSQSSRLHSRGIKLLFERWSIREFMNVC